MPHRESLEATVRTTLAEFLRSIHREEEALDSDTDLARGLGLESDQGLDFALELESALGCALPPDFNPVVHPSGTRGMRLRELVDYLRPYAGDGGGAR